MRACIPVFLEDELLEAKANFCSGSQPDELCPRWVSREPSTVPQKDRLDRRKIVFRLPSGADDIPNSFMRSNRNPLRDKLAGAAGCHCLRIPPIGLRQTSRPSRH
ncbi:hypothetical protein NKJ26_31810 [Mesorhizobium sp. M0152]|uniref:hypothetical protein n=1 Tax=Mesorhizobium sp. M0152 TaxID=2956898 RepID=UPI00333ABD95